MIRTQVYLTEKEKKGLESIAKLRGVSQSDLIRKAVDDLLEKSVDIDKHRVLDEIAGVWKGRDDIPDLEELRAGWGRRTAK